jgi:hypothetical protein
LNIQNDIGVRRCLAGQPRYFQIYQHRELHEVSDLPGDVVAVFSNGGIGRIHQQLLDRLKPIDLFPSPPDSCSCRS